MKRWASIVFMLIIYSEKIFGGLLSFQKKQNIINALTDSFEQEKLYRELYGRNGNGLCNSAVRTDPELESYGSKYLFYHRRSDDHGFTLIIDNSTIMDFYHMMECEYKDNDSIPIIKMNFIATPAEYGEHKEANYYRIHPKGVIDGHIAYALNHYIQICKMKEAYESRIVAITEWYNLNAEKPKKNKKICKERKPDEYKKVIDGVTVNKEEMFLALDDASWISLPGILICTVTKSDKKYKETIYFYLEDPINDSWVRIYKYDVNLPNNYVLDLSYANSL